MGMNYFARFPGETSPIHIGKSSYGWVFQLVNRPDLGLVDWPTWKAALQRPNVEITDESDWLVSPGDLFRSIENRVFSHSVEGRLKVPSEDTTCDILQYAPPGVTWVMCEGGFS